MLYVELIGLASTAHDQSMSVVDADMIRPGPISYGITRFSGAPVALGIIDTGVQTSHLDLSAKRYCGLNFTTDGTSALTDNNGHGTHVLATIAGTGAADSRFRGVAPGVGTQNPFEIRVAKAFDQTDTGPASWIESAMDWMATLTCYPVQRPLVNLSGGLKGYALTGTDSTSRKLDQMVWSNRQLYVVAAGNEVDPKTIRTPGVAKNALTVGSIQDAGLDLSVSGMSSRGPTGDGRMKPNLVAPGETITSAARYSDTSYTTNSGKGTSHAAGHVTGLAATLMEHYPGLQFNPALLRAHMMATAIPRNDVTAKSNEVGLGHASGYLAHWDHPNNDGWSTSWFSGSVDSQAYQYTDIVVPAGAQRLVVVLTWDEPPQSAGATKAVIWDLDLWLDRNADCSDSMGACGEYSSRSRTDNVEYVVVNNPPEGTYRLKVSPYSAPYVYGLPFGLSAMIIRGDPTPALTAYLMAPATATVGSPFSVTVTATAPSYVASGVQVLVAQAAQAQNITYLSIQTTRLDGVTMSFPQPHEHQRLDNPFTFGNLFPSISRSATWTLRADTPGRKEFTITGWSKTGGQFSLPLAVDVTPLPMDLVEVALTTNPPAPTLVPGAAFSVTDTVRNDGMARSGASTTRYYLSLDAVKSAGDVLLTGSRGVPALAAGVTSSGTVTVTIPAATPLDTYFLLACADNANTVDETDEANNCIATPGAVVTVGRPDLAASAVSNPPATKARGGKFQVTDTVQNVGAATSKASTTRHYLSLDAVKGAGDTLLAGGRSVPALAPGASHSGTITVTIPAGTTPNTYFLLACADNANSVVETDEINNCKASSTTVTVTP